MRSRVTEVAQDIFLIDCLFAGLPGQCGAFLVRGDISVLIDAGPSVNAADVIVGLKELGLSAADISHILLTHFHLDHAGAVSYLLAANPEMTVFVDPGSISFLEEPGRLVRSAHKSLGAMAPHYGTMSPVASERMVALQDGYKLELGGGRILTAVKTPGHSKGHFAFWEPESGALLCGDALGHFLQDAGYVFPASPAPEFDLDISIASAARLAALEPRMLLFPHYGCTHAAQAIIQQFVDQVKRFVGIAADLEAEERNPQHLAEVFFRDLPDLPAEAAALQLEILRVNAAGILHYLRRSEREGV